MFYIVVISYSGIKRRSVPWQVSILRRNRARVCSGALVLLKNRPVVLTTAKCAAIATRRGNIRLANKKVLRIRSFNRKRRGLAVINFVWNRRSRKGVFPIRIARFISTRRSSYVTVRESATQIRLVQNKIIRYCRKKIPNSNKFERIFKPFNPWNDFCTLPAGFPSTTKYVGSPLIQIYLRRAYLVGLLTDLTSSSLAGASFGKYTKVGHVN